MKNFLCVVAVSLLFALLFAPTTIQAQGKASVTEEQVKQAVTQLEKLAQHEVDTQAVPGIAIAIVFQDQVVYTKGFGVRAVGKPEPIDADTVFQLASVSKPIGATVIAALVGEGKITWDSRLSELDPTFEMYDPYVSRQVTLRDMYAHRSGLPEHIGDLMHDLGYSRADILYRLRFQKPASSFRTTFAYTNFGMTEAGVAAAKAYDLEWEEASEQKLYKPLGMTATSSRHADYVARTNKAIGHVLVDGKWVHKTDFDPESQSPGGGVSSSAKDLAQWVRLQLANGKFEGKQIVDEQALLETRTPQILTGSSQIFGTPTFYGLGWDVGIDDQGRLRMSHSGAFGAGAATVVNLVPQEQLGIAVLTNGYPVGIAEGLAAIFMKNALQTQTDLDLLKLYKDAYITAIRQLIGGNPIYATPPASPSLALKNDAYVGTYTNEFYGDISIVEKDGGLAIVEGPKQMTFSLTHFDRDVFTYETVGESAVGRTGIIFTIGASGSAASVRVENLDGHGSGTFIRLK